MKELFHFLVLILHCQREKKRRRGGEGQDDERLSWSNDILIQTVIFLIFLSASQKSGFFAFHQLCCFSSCSPWSHAVSLSIPSITSLHFDAAFFLPVSFFFCAVWWRCFFFHFPASPANPLQSTNQNTVNSALPENEIPLNQNNQIDDKF